MTNTPPDAFATLTDLIALLADSKTTAKRIADLRTTEDRITRAKTKLDGERDAHDRAVATATREMDEREAKLRKREVDVMIRDNALREAQRILDASKPPRYHDDANLGPGGRSYSGLTREPDHG